MSNDNLKTWPEKIWLQVHDEGKTLPAYSLKEGYGDEITWCGDSVWSCEIKYIRADLVPELPSVLKIAFCIRRAGFPDFRNEEWFDLHSTVRGLLCLQAGAVLALLQEQAK